MQNQAVKNQLSTACFLCPKLEIILFFCKNDDIIFISLCIRQTVKAAFRMQNVDFVHMGRGGSV